MKGGALQRQCRLARPSERRRIRSAQRERAARFSRKKRTTCAGAHHQARDERGQRGEEAGENDVRGSTINAARTQETG